MHTTGSLSSSRWLFLAALYLTATGLTPQAVAAQGFTGTLIVTVADAQGGVLNDASVRVKPADAGDQRILIEPRGTRRLASQSLLDLSVSKAFRVGKGGQRIEVILDVLNALNDSASENLTTDTLYTYGSQGFVESANFARPSVFIDPRRAMLSVRLSLGR